MKRRTVLRAAFGTAAAGALGGVLAGDLAHGHPVPSGAVGSGAAHLGARLLSAAGLAPGTDVPVRHLRLADAAAALRAGSVTGPLVADGVPVAARPGDRAPGPLSVPVVTPSRW
ncbi:hypothetical protein ABZY14_16205 [Streptomyces sp. NPDC006617]|uniref:hypothetical protein n=1 Tax=Streptomyces sp. NPDC006617 TaxID=3155354 RepID=UPI0033B56F15